MTELVARARRAANAAGTDTRGTLLADLADALERGERERDFLRDRWVREIVADLRLVLCGEKIVGDERASARAEAKVSAALAGFRKAAGLDAPAASVMGSDADTSEGSE
jgi:hypothetical protein